jgi:hypothetical protein
MLWRRPALRPFFAAITEAKLDELVRKFTNVGGVESETREPSAVIASQN